MLMWAISIWLIHTSTLRRLADPPLQRRH